MTGEFQTLPKMKPHQLLIAIALVVATEAYPHPAEDGQPDNNGNGTFVFVATTSQPSVRDEELTCLEEKAKERRNKETVLALFKGVFHDYDTSVVEKYVDPKTYIQHNPFLSDGVDNLRECIIDWGKGREKEPLDIRRTSAEGDFVWVHHKVRGKFSRDVAAIHVYRLENGKVIEHWDQFQPIPDLVDSKNPHPLI